MQEEQSLTKFEVDRKQGSQAISDHITRQIFILQLLVLTSFLFVTMYLQYLWYLDVCE